MSGVPGPEQADPRLSAIEYHVARRIRLRRLQTGLTLMQVAERLRMSHQQVHKYETGSSRITAGQLGRLAEALRIDIAFFFQGIAPMPVRPELQEARQRLVELTDIVVRIADPLHRDTIVQLVKTLADGEDTGAEAT